MSNPSAGQPALVVSTACQAHVSGVWSPQQALFGASGIHAAVSAFSVKAMEDGMWTNRIAGKTAFSGP
jgi:hypothetical protein